MSLKVQRIWIYIRSGFWKLLLTIPFRFGQLLFSDLPPYVHIDSCSLATCRSLDKTMTWLRQIHTSKIIARFHHGTLSIYHGTTKASPDILVGLLSIWHARPYNRTEAISSHSSQYQVVSDLLKSGNVGTHALQQICRSETPIFEVGTQKWVCLE